MKRSQIAVEFLMTYGWALLGVFMVVAAIIYFGVIDSSTFVPERCDLGYRLLCKDYQLTKAGVATLAIVNSFPNDIMVTSLELNSTKFAGACIYPVPGVDQNILIGQVKQYSFNCIPQLPNIKSSRKESYGVTVWYYLNGTTPAYTYPLYGEIYARLS
jgi:hypothetical protein